MAGKSGIVVKLLVAGVLLVVAAVAALNLSRPTVDVRPAKRGVAMNEVWGAVKIQAEGGVREVPAKYGGTVMKSALAPNRRVKEGDELILLDTRDIDLEIEMRRLQLTEAKALQDKNLAKTSPAWFAVEEATLKQKTVENQKSMGTVSDDAVKAANLNVKKGEAEVATEKSHLEIAVKTIENALNRLALQKDGMTITAPMDGTITEVLVHPNEQIGPGPVAKMISNKRRVQAKIDGSRYSDVKVGQDAIVNLTAYPNREFKAKVVEVATSPDPETQRYFVDLDIVDIPEGELLQLLVSGLEGNALINVGQKPNAILAPVYAVNGTRVLVVKDGRVVERRVQVGFRGRYEHEILKGLDEGDLVILDLAAKVSPGDRVKTRVVAE